MGPTLWQPRHYFPEKGCFADLKEFGAEETMTWLVVRYGSSFQLCPVGRRHTFALLHVCRHVSENLPGCTALKGPVPMK